MDGDFGLARVACKRSAASAAIFQTPKCLKNEAKQKTLFLLCVVEKVLDGLFQHPVSRKINRLRRSPPQFRPHRRAARTRRHGARSESPRNRNKRPARRRWFPCCPG